jgi:hypothetical protein
VLDQAGVPREGRLVKVTVEQIVIELPHGWTMEDGNPKRERGITPPV